jgi:D-alanyl-lipoteichoic acid acyltransferase DltB (MBOAT superfamily)
VGKDVLYLTGFLAFAVCGRACVAWLRGSLRDAAFALLCLASVGAIFYARRPHGAEYFGIYLAFVATCWALTRLFAKREGRAPYLAFFFPLLILVLGKYVPFGAAATAGGQGSSFVSSLGVELVGLSYMAFRLSYLVLEVRNGSVEMPGLARYLGFALFPPTMILGPISRYATYDQSFGRMPLTIDHAARSLSRLFVGAAKYVFFANLFNQLQYKGLLTDGRPHPPIDTFVAIASYYLYLYFNFSGFCDVAIGIGGLVGLRVDENFDSPFLARNLQQFWNRWHITLSAYMRDTVFTPLSKALVGAFGARGRDHAAAFAIAVVFVLVGIWHGTGLNFLLFGVMHSIGMVAVHYYTLGLKRRLGREGFRRYLDNRWIRSVSRALTFAYVACSLGLFSDYVTVDHGRITTRRDTFNLDAELHARVRAR